MKMSEPNIEQDPQENFEEPAFEEEEEISWEDALVDSERQNHVMKQQAEKTVTPIAEKSQSDESISAAEETNHSVNLQFILDIPLQVTVELGRRQLLVHDLLQLNQGSIIELTKHIGEPFEVLVNRKLVARGEVVVINDKFGVRITDIISPLERVQQL
jgi:flagellar motor switch protein FliN/FliY